MSSKAVPVKITSEDEEGDVSSDGTETGPILTNGAAGPRRRGGGGRGGGGGGEGEIFLTGEKRQGPLARLFQTFVAWTFLLAVVAAFVLLILMKIAAPYFLATKSTASWGGLLADDRCKCVCPHNLNLTITYNTTVWLEEVDDPSACFCENILPAYDDVLCLRCTCSYESRNSILIAVIVIIFLLLCVGLFFYTLFVCLQPLLFKNTRPDRDQYSLLGSDQQDSTGLYNLRLKLQQMRWRQSIAEQRIAETLH